jgi:hypothetical protein
MKICLQAGHENIKTNCDPALRGSTGTGGEVEINIAVRNATATILEENGIEVKKVDANFNCDATSADEDYDLFLAIHGDMDYAGDGGSGFCDYPEPDTDGATERSQYLAKAIESSFFPAVGISIKSKSNANTRYFYMWKHLSLKTPCVLIEMGQVKDAHDGPILQNTPLVASALANAILYGLGVKNPLETKIEALEEELDAMRDSRDKWRTESKKLKAQLEQLIEERDIEVGELTTHIKLLQKDLSEANVQLEVLKRHLTTNKTPLSMYGKWERIVSVFKEVINL